jgi:hypothetical protein
MRIVINHLTRMHDGRVCVAGLDPHSGQHIRPLLPRGHLTQTSLTRFGGPFGIGAAVEIGPVRYAGTPPELEDREFDWRNVRAQEALSPTAFWSVLQQAARGHLREIFGAILIRNGSTLVATPRTGTASLGILRPNSKLHLAVASVNGSLRVRLELENEEGRLSLPVTDVRLFEDDMTTPCADAVQFVADQIGRGVDTFLSVGLSRAWAPAGMKPRHWLQVNNIHLHNHPTWDGYLPGRPPARGQPRTPLQLEDEPF